MAKVKSPPKSPSDSIQTILALIKSKTKVDLSHYKMSTIKRRVERQMRLKKLPTLSKYATFLKSHPDALAELYEDVFVHVTEFFRDPEAFEALKKQVFPALIKGKTSGDTLRVWVAGCSTGEEAYSIAIALTEFLKGKKISLKITVFASDISGVSIHFARRALYQENSLSKITSRKILSYFEKTKEGFKVKKEIRDLCVFSEHDLISNPPFSKIDLITCRNVLIYFGPEIQKKVFQTFNFGLNPVGYLWLGSSESTGTSSKLFEMLDKKFRIFKKLPSAVTPGMRDHLRMPLHSDQAVNSAAHMQKNADQLLLNRYAPSGVIIDSALEVIQFRGKTSPFLSPPQGAPSASLMKMASPELAPYLKQVILDARKKKSSVRKEGLFLTLNDHLVQINIEATPLNPLSKEGDIQYLVLFERVEVPRKIIEKAPKRTAKKFLRSTSDQQLINELETQRDYLQSLFEQHESTQEELMSTNEELQSANEELHSSNEELETAKEELQCANEELTTTNEELHARNDELKQVNEKLARSEERFRLMVSSVKDYAIFMLDTEGKIASWNEGARRFKGYEAEEVIGQHFSKFYTESDIQRRHPEYELREAIAKGRYEEEGWRVRKDGTTFWANVVITRINDSTGKHIGFSKVTRDLTERKKAEEELRKSEERFRLMVSSVKDYAIFMLDPEGHIASWNEGAKRFKGYQASEIIGEHFRKFYTDSDRARKHPEHELEIASKEGRYEEEGWRVRKDGTQFWANVVITRILDASGEILGFVKVTRDLTERRKAEQELRQAYGNLERRVQERTSDLEAALKSRDEFLSIASHELKTPLTSLRLQLQLSSKRISMSKEESKLLEELTKSLDIGVRQVSSLTHLVNDLLDVSRIQTGVFMLQVSSFNLSELVDEIAQRFKEQLEHARNPLRINLAPEVMGQWDRFRMEQVIVNLISNAIKYAPQAPLSLTTKIVDDKAVLEVCDEGPGIEPEYVNRIFQRFERGNTPNNVSGLGLGLFITKKIIEHHGGEISVESAPGKGAKFIISLPLQQK